MRLPRAPHGEEVIRYLKSNAKVFYPLSLLSVGILILGNVFFMQAGFWFYGIFVAALVFYLGLSLLIGFTGRDFSLSEHTRLLDRHFLPDREITIDIYLPVCGEPYEIITNTWEHVATLNRYFGNSCKVHVLDDKRDKRLQVLADKFGFNYITRSSNELKKAGNLRNAFSQTSGEFIIIFDADFCPRYDFIHQTLPYMLDDDRIAIVQTPQFFSLEEQENHIAQGAAGIQELFYRLIQVNRDAKRGAICVGTNALYRRSALVPFGGTAPMPYSEDVHTGFAVTEAGLRVKYLPLNLAAGTCPSTWSSYFIQQYRWSMGSLSLMLSGKFWLSGITMWQRICYLSGMLYYTVTGLSLLFTPLPGLLILTFAPEKIFWWNLCFSIPSFLFSTVFMALWMRGPFTLSILECRQVSYFAHLFALVDIIRGNLEPWSPTGAAVRSSRFEVFRPVFVGYWTALTLVTLELTARLVYEGRSPWDFTLIWFFVGFNIVITARPMLDLLRPLRER